MTIYSFSTERRFDKSQSSGSEPLLILEIKCSMENKSNSISKQIESRDKFFCSSSGVKQARREYSHRNLVSIRICCFFVINYEQGLAGGIEYWLAFALFTQRPWVPISALPRTFFYKEKFLDVAELINRSTLPGVRGNNRNNRLNWLVAGQYYKRTCEQGFFSSSLHC